MDKALDTGGTGSIPGQGPKVCHASWCRQNIEKKKKKVLVVELLRATYIANVLCIPNIDYKI